MLVFVLALGFWLAFIAAPRTLVGTPSLLVLAFDDLTPDKSAAYLASGVADDLTIDLANFPSLPRQGDGALIHTELADANDGMTVWARRFEGKWSELLPMQQQMRAGIAEQLSLRADTGKPRPGSTKDVAAHEEFLKASADWRDRSPAAVGRAIVHLQQATRLDPNYGRAWALMASIYWNSVGVGERQHQLSSFSDNDL